MKSTDSDSMSVWFTQDNIEEEKFEGDQIPVLYKQNFSEILQRQVLMAAHEEVFSNCSES